MKKLAAIQSAIEDINKEAMFGSVLAAGARFGKGLYQGAKGLFTRAPKVTGAGSAAASASAPKVASPVGPLGRVARFPNTWKGMATGVGVSSLPNASGGISGPTGF